MEKKNVVIYPLDGFSSAEQLFVEARKILDNTGAKALLYHLKVNDGVHAGNGPEIMLELRKIAAEDVWLFFDFKLPDTNGTNSNIVKHYLKVMRAGDILTVRESCSFKSFLDLRKVLPIGMKIALVSMLTDTTVEECRLKYGMFPHIKIANDITNIRALWAEKGGKEVASQPFDAVVCSPHELQFLKRNFPDLEFIVPGIRDAWMDAGQQARFTGVAEALQNGASYLVIGSQISKGNPKNGISAEESLRLTIEAVNKGLTEDTPRGIFGLGQERR